VQTAVGRVFYGGGGITPDIEVKEACNTPARARIAEAAFHFTRQLAAGVVPGWNRTGRQSSVRQERQGH
jgi:hypothetical protein